MLHWMLQFPLPKATDTHSMACFRDGVIDKAELKALLQSTDGGREKVTKHKVRDVAPC